MDNKKLIETKDLRRQIPKGFSYFAVDFGLSNGFAHVIESHDHFPSTFATVGFYELFEKSDTVLCTQTRSFAIFASKIQYRVSTRNFLLKAKGVRL